MYLFGIFAFLKIDPFGKGAYLPVDAFSQYTNYLHYFKDIISGDVSILYSLGKSLGGDMYSLFTYYLVSPYNILMLFFPKSEVPYAFTLILALKTASTGLSFFYFLSRKKDVKFSNLIFSCMYALSAYVITYGFNIMWLDSIILLPLVIARFRRFDKSEEKYFLYSNVEFNFNYKLLYGIYGLCIFIFILFIQNIK